MARRRKSSPAEDLMDVVARLPWWAGVALAVASYLVLHRIAGQEVVAAVKLGEMGTMVAQTLWKTLATFGQYLLPLICVAGAAHGEAHGEARSQRGRAVLGLFGLSGLSRHEANRMKFCRPSCDGLALTGICVLPGCLEDYTQ